MNSTSTMGRQNSPMNGMGRSNSTAGGFTNFNGNRFRNQNMDTTTAPILLGVGGGLLFLSLALLVARLWSRLRPVVVLCIDDWTVIAGTILAIVNYIFLSAAVVNGLGRRSRFVSNSRRRTVLELLFISQVFWYWSITLVKLSVACLLLRVKRQHRRWRIFLYFIMGLLVTAAVVQTFFQFLQCRPFSVFWDARALRTGKVVCISARIINGNIVAFSTVQVAVDLIFSFIPITFISKLNLPRREKAGMCVLMALGLFASCAAIIRTLMLQEFNTSPDLFRLNVAVALWAVVELQFALIAATIPTLKAFMEKALIRVGLFFYDESSETQVRGKLVQFGLLGDDERAPEVAVRWGSEMDSPDSKSARSKKSVRKWRDEFEDTEVDTRNDKEVEDMLTRLAF